MEHYMSTGGYCQPLDGNPNERVKTYYRMRGWGPGKDQMSKLLQSTI